MSEWKKVKLGEIGKIITGKTPPTKDKDNYGGNIPFITPVDMVGNRNVFITERYLTEKGKNIVKNCLLPANTICVSCIGSDMGKAVITTQPSITNQQINSIIVDDAHDFRFVFYLMLTQTDVIKSLGKNSTAVPILNKSKFCNIEVSLPSLSTQHRIATILSRYDSLIENYQKQIKLLEEAAQRLYKEWFVDLHFPGHENTKIVDGVPEGWEKNAFGSVIDYEIGGGWGSDTKTTNEIIPAYVIRGTDMSTLDMGIWKELPYRFHQESNYRARQLMHNDIIFEVSGGSKNEGVAKTFLVQQELLDKLDNHVICASFCKLIRLKDSSIAYYIYDTLKEWRASGITAQYDKRSASSIVNYRWKDFLSQQEILIPKEIVLHDYIKKSELIRSLITKKSSQIRLLTEARDRLLPKLMSGEIAV